MADENLTEQAGAALVLAEHEPSRVDSYQMLGGLVACSCGVRLSTSGGESWWPAFMAHQADELAKAGLLRGKAWADALNAAEAELREASRVIVLVRELADHYDARHGTGLGRVSTGNVAASIRRVLGDGQNHPQGSAGDVPEGDGGTNDDHPLGKVVGVLREAGIEQYKDAGAREFMPGNFMIRVPEAGRITFAPELQAELNGQIDGWGKRLAARIRTEMGLPQDEPKEPQPAYTSEDRPGRCRCSLMPVFEREGDELFVPATECPCAACDPGLVIDGKPSGLPSRMNVCPDCGNKRCPKAANHATWQCSGSNAVGQVGVRVDDSYVADAGMYRTTRYPGRAG